MEEMEECSSCDGQVNVCNDIIVIKPDGSALAIPCSTVVLFSIIVIMVLVGRFEIFIFLF